jgi:hypothetical protein
MCNLLILLKIKNKEIGIYIALIKGNEKIYNI